MAGIGGRAHGILVRVLLSDTPFRGPTAFPEAPGCRIQILPPGHRSGRSTYANEMHDGQQTDARRFSRAPSAGDPIFAAF